MACGPPHTEGSHFVKAESLTSGANERRRWIKYIDIPPVKTRAARRGKVDLHSFHVGRLMDYCDDTQPETLGEAERRRLGHG